MTKTERETLELLAKGYNEELKREDVSLAARRALEEIDGINVNCCGRGRPDPKVEHVGVNIDW